MSDSKALEATDSPAASGRLPSRNGNEPAPSAATSAVLVEGAADGTRASQDITAAEAVDSSKKGYFAYFRTREFYVVLLLGQVLALCITATNTFTNLLANAGTSIPSFQTLFNYVLLAVVYTGYTIYRYGFKGWLQVVYKRGWKCQSALSAS
ncbi:hypothetical protein LOZ12_005182 [Ophidiomyces ophidiicola]|uniref:Uncharacterized protein n=1 Tax=Ophidiomyces ophidiicola TaxID=1387563 RepID=A0ACB8UVL1_9EURO|nr:hypothetical protein LOZ64_001446 [Ophidiomyces ophidiicola]KAI1946286.1 hypothetical protein LOZ62_003396 [Ophidiomyces ophidiicola]KAI1971391.1 hypothetical protein LOZ56_003091 [Ophidiomyces ophidiicola]KAI2001754.1 hypothetical protein LOZ50_005454 [Ophidiomyces ophidiicola]KAI2030670.1 hypothetical protein LOZ45_001452 [Ophidiomyces ophidiicola]